MTTWRYEPEWWRLSTLDKFVHTTSSKKWILVIIIIIVVLPNLYFLWLVHSKLPQKTALLGGEQIEPWKVHPTSGRPALIIAPLSLERSKRSFPHYIPLTGAFKNATKTSTFRRRAKRVLKSAPLSLTWWCSLCASEQGLTNGCGHSSTYCIQQSILIIF